MIKAFISHSSKQKAFAIELVNKLGRDYCIIDCYDFQPAYKTIEEIYNAIDKSSVFVLLISKESLDSDWVNEEIRYARKKLLPDQADRFWPFLIDSTIGIDDCPEWMVKDECFNLKQFKSPLVLARDIEQKFRRIIWSSNARIRALETMMVGRNDDIAKFEDKFQSIRGFSLKALIVSGRNGVGKETFARQCMHKVGFPMETEPYRISTNPNESVEDFIMYLNLFLCKYNDQELTSVLAQKPEEKADEVVQMLNELYETRSVVFVEDNGSLILNNRRMPEWLNDVLGNPALNNQLGLFVLSQKIPNTFIESDCPQIAHIQLNPLDRKDRVKLFVSCMRAYGLTNISQEDISFFVDKLLFSPIQIVKVVEAIYNNTPIPLIKRDLDSVIRVADKKISPVLDYFKEEEQRYLLIIMSRMEFVSYRILESIFAERIIEIMETIYSMMEYGIITSFGPSEQFFRLDHYVSDYIRRYHFTMPKDWEDSVNEIMEDQIRTSSSITEDASLYLYDLKRQLISGRSTAASSLFPSVVVSSVMDVYNDRQYPVVVKICDSCFNGAHSYYPEIERELRYWLCLALCRMQDDRFYEEVKKLKGVDDLFLRGFYFRIAENFPEAERYYRRTLSQSKNLQRAKRELVTTLLAQNKFSQALDLARENYENDQDNSYQIHGYFRCLVRKKIIDQDDNQMLLELLEAMRNNYSDKHEELFAAMSIEYNAYAVGLPSNEINSMISEAKSRFPSSVNIERAAHNYKYRNKENKEKFFREDC